MLKFNPKNKKYTWRGTFKQRTFPKQAGFEWDDKLNIWWTASPYIAYLLRKYAAPEALAQLFLTELKVQDSAQHDNSFVLSENPLPEGESYYPFQEAGVENMTAQLRSRRSVMCADDPGLGKTIQAVGIANNLKLQKILVICPASLRLMWVEALERWHMYNPGATPILKGDTPYDDKSSIVVSYHLAEKAKKHKPDFIIIDEAHYLKNPDAKRTQLILGDVQSKWSGLIAAAPAVILTGTPLPNGKPNELWSILFKCAPESISYMKSWPFMRRFCKLEFDGDGGYNVLGAERKPELFVRLRGSGFMTRRLKKDVLKDLPPKRHKMVVFPASGSMKKILEKESEFSASEILKHGVPAASALAETRRLMGIEKVPQAVEYITNLLESGVEKIVVFAWHVEVNEMLAERLKKFNPALILGKTSAKRRQENVDGFQTDPKTRVIIGNLQSMGTGWTLTRAHDVVFVEGSWVPGENEQSADRLHRIGQLFVVILHFLVVEGSLDGRILGAAAMKAIDSREVLDGG